MCAFYSSEEYLIVVISQYMSFSVDTLDFICFMSFCLFLLCQMAGFQLFKWTASLFVNMPRMKAYLLGIKDKPCHLVSKEFIIPWHLLYSSPCQNGILIMTKVYPVLSCINSISYFPFPTLFLFLLPLCLYLIKMVLLPQQGIGISNSVYL